MTTKLLEVRDAGTLVPVLAIQVSGADGYLMRHAGFGDEPMIWLINLVRQAAHWDPYDWPTTSGRTMPIAHHYIGEHWRELQDHDVVDVEFILGETTQAKVSERLTVVE